MGDDEAEIGGDVGFAGGVALRAAAPCHLANRAA
jgi:hypothetical protein